MARLAGSFLISWTLFIPASSPAAVQPLDFMTGHWCRSTERGVTEEIWFPPAGGETIGMNRSIREGRQSGFEFMRIARIDGETTFIAQPGGQAPVEFTRVDGGDGWIRFENPDHDFPTSIEYRRSGETLEATISGPGDAGEAMSIDFSFELCGEVQRK